MNDGLPWCDSPGASVMDVILHNRNLDKSNVSINVWAREYWVMQDAQVFEAAALFLRPQP